MESDGPRLTAAIGSRDLWPTATMESPGPQPTEALKTAGRPSTAVMVTPGRSPTAPAERPGRLAIAVTLYILGVVYLGAYVRHADLSLACLDWPLCNGQIVPPLDTVTGVVFAHRVAALGAVLLLGLLAIRVRSSMAVWAFALGILQALSGALIVWSRLGLLSTLLHAEIGAAPRPAGDTRSLEHGGLGVRAGYPAGAERRADCLEPPGPVEHAAARRADGAVVRAARVRRAAVVEARTA